MDIIQYVIDKKGKRWSRNTILNFRSRTRKYFEILGIEPTEEYFKGKHNYKQDIEKAWGVIVEKPSSTRKGFLSCIKIFYKYHNIEFKSLFWEELSSEGKGSGPIILDKVPTNQQLKQMLLHTDIRGKSLFLFSATSGMRIDAQLQLTWDDIDLKSHPKLGIVTVPWEYTKKGSPRNCFITEETKNILLEWEKERNTYIESINKKLKNLPRVDYEAKKSDPRIWPFSYSSALYLFHDMLQKSGFTEKEKHESKFTKNGKKYSTKRYKYHIHAMRKFAKTRLSLAGVPEKIVNFIIGHKGYMYAYDRPDIQELIPFYMKAYNSLLIFESQPDLTNVNEEIQTLKDENQELRLTLQETRQDFLELMMKFERHEKAKINKSS